MLLLIEIVWRRAFYAGHRGAKIGDLSSAASPGECRDVLWQLNRANPHCVRSVPVDVVFGLPGNQERKIGPDSPDNPHKYWLSLQKWRQATRAFALTKF